MQIHINCCLIIIYTHTIAQQKLKVVVAGLNHDHVHNILHAFKNGQVTIVGIAEPNKLLWKKFGKEYSLPDSLFTDDLETLVKQKKPDAVLGYNEVAAHVRIVEICAPLHIPVMVRKAFGCDLATGKRDRTTGKAIQYDCIN